MAEKAPKQKKEKPPKVAKTWDKALGFYKSRKNFVLEENFQLLEFTDAKWKDAYVKCIAECSRVGQSLKCLILKGCELSKKSIPVLAEALKEAKYLETIDLEATSLSCELAVPLAEAFQQNTSVTSLNLARMSRNYASCNSLSDQGAEMLAVAIKTNKTLRSLNLLGNSVGSAGAQAIRNALESNTSIIDINLDKNELSAINDSDVLSDIKQLLTRNREQRQLSETKSSKALSLQAESNTEDEVISAIRTGTASKPSEQVTTLRLNTALGPRSAQALAKTVSLGKGLSQLILKACYIGAYAALQLAESIPACEKLTELVMPHNSIQDAGMDAISVAIRKRGKPLIRLDVSYNKFGDIGTIALADCMQLIQNVDSVYNQSTHIGMARVAKSLASGSITESINLSGNPIKSQGMAYFAKSMRSNTTLRAALFQSCGIGLAGAQSLAAMIEDAEPTTVFGYLNIQNNFVGVEGLQVLYSAVNNYRGALTEVDIRNNWAQEPEKWQQQFDSLLGTPRPEPAIEETFSPLVASSSEMVADCMKKGKTFYLDEAVSSLRLGSTDSNHQLEDFEFTLLVDAIQQSGHLGSLILTSNKLSDHAAYSLASVLAVNRTITKISLARNRIGDAGAERLAEALCVNESITELDLARNAIGLHGAVALAKVLETNTMLKSLNLANNDIGVDGPSYFADSLQRNTTLVFLSLEGSGFNPADRKVHSLHQILLRNQAGLQQEVPTKFKLVKAVSQGLANESGSERSTSDSRPTGGASSFIFLHAAERMDVQLQWRKSKYLQVSAKQDQSELWTKNELSEWRSALENTVRSHLRDKDYLDEMQLIECAEQALGTLFTMLDQFHHKAASAVRTAPEFNYACTMFQFLQDDLQRAKYHLAHLDFSIGIVGNVNVGKSSTLNALIGWNLSPRRNSAMTMIPCRFVNVPTQQTPILSFSMWQYFQGVLEKLRKRYKECLTLIETTDDDFARYDLEAALHNVETAQPKLLNIIADPSTAIVCNVEGEQAILQQLELLNDMVRLVHSEPFYESEAAASMLKNMSTSLDVFPIITVKFRNSSFVPENAVGTVTLIDTPGPNESDFQSAASATGGEPAIAAFLREIYQRILSQVNALIITDANIIQSSQEQGMFGQKARRFKEHLHIVANKLDTYEPTDAELQQQEDDYDEMALHNIVHERVKKVVLSQLPRGPWLKNVFLVSSRNYLLCNRLMGLVRSGQPLQESDKREFKQAFNRAPPTKLSEAFLQRAIDKARMEEFLCHIQSGTVSGGAQWALGNAAAMIGFVVSQLQFNFAMQLESKSNRVSIIAFLDGVLGEIKEEFEEEAQFIKKQCAACAFAIRAVAEHYSKKLLSLAKTISSPAMDSPNHHALAFEEIFGRSAASKIVSLGGGDSTLVRAEAKKVARAAMAELQKRVLLNTINQETQQPEVVHALSLIESRHTEFQEDLQSKLREGLQQMMSLKSDSLNVEDELEGFDLKNSDLIISNFLLRGSHVSSTKFIDKATTVQQVLKGLFTTCANNLLSEMERYVPTTLEKALTQLRSRFYSRLWSHVGSLSSAMETELDARGGANITNANLLIGSIQKLLQDTARHFSHLIPNCEPKIRADLSAMNTFGDLPMGSLASN